MTHTVVQEVLEKNVDGTILIKMTFIIPILCYIIMFGKFPGKMCLQILWGEIVIINLPGF